MKTLLHVKGSPRGDLSISGQLGASFVEAYRAAHPDHTVDELDLWAAGLPEFDGDSSAAKLSYFGEAAMNDRQRIVHDELTAIFRRFNAADEYLFTIPMWNFGVPYKLKQYIDILSMPSTLFGWDPAVGYIGLLHNKRATAIYTAAIYSPGVTPAYGTNHTTGHFEDWLRFAGITDITSVAFWGSKFLPNPEQRFEEAREAARMAARRMA
jgi:FMN-dependent NADH-azoreductase